MGRRAVAALALAALTACTGPLGRQYEYEEEIYLGVNGSATVIVNASIAALVALRGLDLDPSPAVRIDRARIRTEFSSSVATVTTVSRPWRRHGRPFVQVRLTTPDITRLAAAAPFAWASYRLTRTAPPGPALIEYRQALRDSAQAPVPGVTWTGNELVAVRLHLPSRIQFHNAPSKTVDRGNILSWEQPLTDRLAGKPLDIEVRIESETILVRTLAIFGLAVAGALAALAAVVWRVRARGVRRLQARA